MVPTVYIDTSVAGGRFDAEFEFWTNLFFKAVDKQLFKLAISSLLDAELENAPKHIRDFIDQIPDHNMIEVDFNTDSRILANKYLHAGIVGPTSLTDCRHIATATVNKIDILTSWNFKHIVNLHKIRLYNAINIQNGFSILEIRTPRELLDYGN